MAIGGCWSRRIALTIRAGRLIYQGLFVLRLLALFQELSTIHHSGVEAEFRRQLAAAESARAMTLAQQLTPPARTRRTSVKPAKSAKPAKRPRKPAAPG
ncbi:hypothetical protein E8F12_27640 [Pseudomonas sp. BN102]|nr:hypothetical protein [Pseudomonas sp. BN102]